jgi:hypothetical protein
MHVDTSFFPLAVWSQALEHWNYLPQLAKYFDSGNMKPFQLIFRRLLNEPSRLLISLRAFP